MIVRGETEHDRLLMLTFLASKIRDVTADSLVGNMPYEIAAAVNDDNEIIGVFLYTNFRKVSIEITCAGNTGWLTRSNLREFLSYPFEQLGCRRVTAIVHRKNKLARNITERLGFKLEGICRQGFSDGDACIYGLIRKDCRWI